MTDVDTVFFCSNLLIERSIEQLGSMFLDHQILTRQILDSKFHVKVGQYESVSPVRYKANGK